MRSRLPALLCVAVVCIVLNLGLWPFHAPANSVSWLPARNGLAFAKAASVFTPGDLRAEGPVPGSDGSVEVWAQPSEWRTATLLTLYNPRSRAWLAIRQSLTDLEVAAESPNHHAGIARSDFHVHYVLARSLQRRMPVFITAAWGSRGVAVYLNGVLVRTVPAFQVPAGVLGARLILADRPEQPDNFRGQVFGLALYQSELDAAAVLRHYRAWTGAGKPGAAPEEGMVALYLFDERGGDTVRNHVPGGAALSIPRTYTVVDKKALEPFWNEFEFARSYWSGNFKNIVGFLPVGFCFYVYFTVARPLARPAVAAVIAGALISFAIEVLQIFLPTRDSGTTDLITNTLGTWLGVLCRREIYPPLQNRFPWLASLPFGPAGGPNKVRANCGRSPSAG